MKTQIDKNIPLPPNPQGPKAIKYPFRDMDIGDSIFSSSKNIKSAAHYFKCRNPDYNFTVRKVEGGWRCWRIEKKEK